MILLVFLVFTVRKAPASASALERLALLNRVTYFEGMLAIRLDPDTEKRLETLAKKTGRTKAFYAREAILRHLEELEDIYLATERLSQPAETFSSEEVKRELGL